MGVRERKERIAGRADAIVSRHLKDMTRDQPCEHGVSRADAAAKQRCGVGRGELPTRHPAERARHGMLVLAKRTEARVEASLDAEAIHLQFGESVRDTGQPPREVPQW